MEATSQLLHLLPLLLEMPIVAGAYTGVDVGLRLYSALNVLTFESTRGSGIYPLFQFTDGRALPNAADPEPHVD